MRRSFRWKFLSLVIHEQCARALIACLRDTTFDLNESSSSIKNLNRDSAKKLDWYEFHYLAIKLRHGWISQIISKNNWKQSRESRGLSLTEILSYRSNQKILIRNGIFDVAFWESPVFELLCLERHRSVHHHVWSVSHSPTFKLIDCRTCRLKRVETWETTKLVDFN